MGDGVISELTESGRGLLELGGWGFIVWVVAGLVVLRWAVRALAYRVRRALVRKVVTALLLSVYAGGIPATLGLGGFLSTTPAQCQQVQAEGVGINNAPAAVICRAKQAWTDLRDGSLQGRDHYMRDGEGN